MGQANRRGTQFVRIVRGLTNNFGVQLAEAERRHRRRERLYQVLIVLVCVIAAIRSLFSFSRTPTR